MTNSKLMKELLLEDDTWELWGSRYILKEEEVLKDSKWIKRVWIIAEFDPTQCKYIYKPIYKYEIEEN